MRSEVLRYIRDLELMHAGDRVAVAVSGGADSIALLRVLLELRAELGIVLAVAHFNHELRGEASDADQAFVADLTRHLGLQFFSGHCDVRGYASSGRLSIEAAGRELRYEWFAQLADEERFDSVATAHTLDDQAETVLLKFLRGAGTRGLAGICPQISRGAERRIRFVRPLLSITRDEVERYLTSLGQAWREDESNLDHRFARNRVRHELLPLLERGYNPSIRRMLSDIAEMSRAEEEYWQALVERELRGRTSGAKTPSGLGGLDGAPEGAPPHNPHHRALFPASWESSPLQTRSEERRLSLANFQALPLALQRRLLRRFAESEGLTLDFEHVENLLRCTSGELPRTELPGGWQASRRGERLELCAPAPEQEPFTYEYNLPIPGEVRISEIGITIGAIVVRQGFAHESSETDTLLSSDLLGPQLTVRNWHPGDRFWPAHRGSEEKLKRLFAEKRIPQAQRAPWPVALAGDDIVWVRGFPAARDYAWRGKGDAVKIQET